MALSAFLGTQTTTKNYPCQARTCSPQNLLKGDTPYLKAELETNWPVGFQFLLEGTGGALPGRVWAVSTPSFKAGADYNTKEGAEASIRD